MPLIPPISKDINLLEDNFKNKFNAWRKEVIAKYPNAIVFEARRSLERQKRLMEESDHREAKGLPRITWTMKSNHLLGKAVDIVFRNNGVIEWKGPYADLITIAKKYGIKNLAPTELCHFEDDLTPFKVDPMKGLSTQDVSNLLEMQKLGFRSGELGDINLRTLVILGRIFKYYQK